ncbi:MAG TPA: dCMP deaminase family protein [Ilumatobacter sp.]
MTESAADDPTNGATDDVHRGLPDAGGVTALPGRSDYYLALAFAAARRANCRGRRVGAILVKGDRVIATGYNGTPEGLPNCLDGGCLRCADRARFASGTDYDLCICVHAESNALLTAGRFGASTDATTVYTTDQPCFACSKELIQAGVVKVYYARTWAPDPRVADDYQRLQRRLDAEHVPIDYEIVSVPPA